MTRPLPVAIVGWILIASAIAGMLALAGFGIWFGVDDRTVPLVVALSVATVLQVALGIGVLAGSNTARCLYLAAKPTAIGFRVFQEGVDVYSAIAAAWFVFAAGSLLRPSARSYFDAGMYRTFLAVRYLLTRPINLLGIGGILISVWALVVVVSLFSGFLQVVENHVKSASADIVVSRLPVWSKWPDVRAELLADPNVQGVAPRMMHYGMLLRPGTRPAPAPLPGRSALHGGDQPFLSVLGIDAESEQNTTDFPKWVRHADIPSEFRVANVEDPLAPRDGRPSVLLGLERLQREGLSPGDPVRLTTAQMKVDEHGNWTPVRLEIELTVAGAYRTEHGGFDGNNVFVALPTLQERLYPGNAEYVQEVAVRCFDPEQVDETRPRLQRAVTRAVEREGNRFGTVETWRQKNGKFLENVAHQRALMKIVLIVIMVVAAFLMLATLSMMVTEKTGDIGILTAMGGTPLGVTEVFLGCGLVITMAGVASGLGLGVLTALYLEEIRQAVLWAFGVDLFPLDVYNLTRVPCRIEPWWLLEVTMMALVTGLLVSVMPAIRAARHDPLVSLRGT